MRKNPEHESSIQTSIDKEVCYITYCESLSAKQQRK